MKALWAVAPNAEQEISQNAPGGKQTDPGSNPSCQRLSDSSDGRGTSFSYLHFDSDFDHQLVIPV